MILDPEVKKAYAYLEDAIRNLIQVKGYSEGEPTMMLTDWVIFTAHAGYLADGDSITGHIYLLSNEGSLPTYKAVGLARMGQKQLESLWDEDGDDGE